jgi:hypothetical protein
VTELNDTVRGEGGFGSTGVKSLDNPEKKQRVVSPTEMDTNEQPSAEESN